MEKKDTIELIDLLRVIWKWKWFIVILTAAGVTVAGIVTYSAPRIYEVSMVIEPGVFDIAPDGRFIYLDSALNIKTKIESQAYNNEIYKKLDINPASIHLNFKAIQPGNSNTIRVKLEVRDVGIGIQAATALFHELAEEYQHYVGSKRSELEQKIALNRSQLEVSSGEKEYLNKEIAAVKANTERIIKERDSLLSKGVKEVDRLSLLVYTNVIQQNMAHSNELNKQLGTLMADIEKMKSEIESLKIRMNSVENIKLIQSPQSSIYPVRPNKRLNILAGLVIGLIVSTLLAFFLEYIITMKESSNPTPS